MSMTLRPGETLLAKARIHWISCVRETAILLFAVFLAVSCLTSGSTEDRGNRLMIAIVILAVGIIPLLRTWLRNKCNTFTVTSQRIVVDEGVLSRLTTEIPLSKINDITMRRGLFQRLVGAGDI